jgi:hypothetical protein
VIILARITSLSSKIRSPFGATPGEIRNPAPRPAQRRFRRLGQKANATERPIVSFGTEFT